MMTPEEFCQRMRAIFNSDKGDEEDGHGDADALMCKVLRALGYGEGVAVFEAADKWYA